jgi:UDP-3-O-[3-hydroxymyristoyl] N-acetylglucosamine deacetylase/3-hydroxyacyl-[acyl-carrier-protein] dehydratase
MPYVQALQTAGIKQLDAEREYFEIEETISYSNEEKHVEIVALPNNNYRVTVMVDYFNPALGSQHTGLFDLEKEFVTEFAPARTFCFLTEVEMLRKHDLIKGGSLDSALVIVDKEMNNGELDNIKSIFNLQEAPKIGQSGILNDTPLRFKNEPARHKLLDMIGDMTLIGVPVKGQILAARPGHASNYEFSKLIRQKYLEKKQKEKYLPNKNKQVVMDVDQIKQFLPHRYPFLLVDRITHLDTEKKEIIGYKNVTVNEPFFPGHFPQKPVMPGVLICEAMAQVGGMLLLQEVGELNGRLALFMGIKSAKFRKPVLPGDQLVMEVKMVNKRFNTYWMQGVAMVDGNIAAESEFQVALVDGEL